MRFLKTIISLLFVNICISGISQKKSVADTLNHGISDTLKKVDAILNENQKKPAIKLTSVQAIKFLERKYQDGNWKNYNDPLRTAMGQLIYEASHSPFDSCDNFLRKYPYDSLDISWQKFYNWKPVKFKIPVVYPPVSPVPVDSLLMADTSKVVKISDTIKVSELQILKPVPISQPSAGLKDTMIFVITDTLHEVSSARPGFPFYFYENPYQSDSIRTAIDTLLNFIENRDSSTIYITGKGNEPLQVMLNSKASRMQRYWLKNDLNDSVTVWVGATSRNTLDLYLERGVDFSRSLRQANYSRPRIEVQEIDKSRLLEVKKIPLLRKFWKFRTEASFALNQASLTNWVKGGESNISTLLDITGYANYDNKEKKMTSNNFVRLKYGLMATNEYGIRKNLDVLETSSKINHKAFGRFDFSGILLFKSQIAKGYNYPNDSVPVSKFFNPAIITAGIGLDYKPNKTTSFNLSPISYKGTFVPDTGMIDQTKYGIPANRRAMHEPGASFVFTNELKPFKTVKISNRLQLFTNYIHNPQNIDIDWEMIATISLNWFTEVRLNTQFIFDDDTKTPVFDKEKNPVLGPDGKQKTAARVQFKELLGFSFIFKF